MVGPRTVSLSASFYEVNVEAQMVWHATITVYIYARCDSIEILCEVSSYYVDFSSFFFRSRRILTILSLKREEVCVCMMVTSTFFQLTLFHFKWSRVS